MSLGSKHYNWLFVGKKHCDVTLLNERVFPEIMAAVEPLLAHTNVKKCRISAEQWVNAKKVKFGRPRWSKESLLPICENFRLYPENKTFHFTFLTAEFPSIDSAYEKNETVDVYLYFENDLVWGKVKSEGDCGLLISLREDIFDSIGESTVKEVLRKIYAIFDSAKVLFHKRGWWSKLNTEESAIQDVAAWRAIDKMSARKYKNWTEIDLNTYLLPEHLPQV